MNKYMRVGMIPYLTGDEWEAKGNPHLRKLVDYLSEAGWEIIPLDAEDFSEPYRLVEKKLAIIFVHWPSSMFDLIGYRNESLMGKIWQYFDIRGRSNCVSFLHTVSSCVCKAGSYISRNFYLRSALREIRTILGAIDESKIPVVWEIHDLGSHHLADKPELAFVERQFHQGLYQASSAIVVHEQSCIHPVSESFGTSRPYAVAQLGPYEYGAPVEPDAARMALNILCSGKVFAYIGTGRPNRNPADTVMAFLSVAGKDDRLIVAGLAVGAFIPDWITDTRITVLDGFQQPERVRDILCAADFVINDAKMYLTSAVVRAAMTYGVPIIARPFGSALDMAAGAAIFIDEGGIEQALKRALSLDKHKYEAMRCQARERNAERSWERSSERINLLFHEILNGFSAVPPL